MKMKKIMSLALGTALVILAAGCGQNSTAGEGSQTAAETETAAGETGGAAGEAKAPSETGNEDSGSTSLAGKEEVAGTFCLEYPAHMQELGYTDIIEMDVMPERIVCLTTYPVMTLYDMGVPLLAVPTTSVLDYPDDLNAQELPAISSDTFSAESIVELEPDLVIMAAGQQADYGDTLTSLGIPVYYVATNSQTHNMYDVIREQSQSLVDAFSMTEELARKGAQTMDRFNVLDARVEKLKTICQGKTVLMLLAGGPTDMYLQTEKATLGCMATMCGLESVYHNDQAASMIPLDMEAAIEYDPDIVLITGSGTSEDVQALMEGVYELNPDFWNSIPAVAEGRVIYLPGEYVSTAGINIINNIQDLADLLEQYFSQE